MPYMSYHHLTILLNLQNTEKLANLRSLFDAQILKKFQFRGGGLRTLTPHQGSVPWTPAGGSAPDPNCRLALVRSPCVLSHYSCRIVTTWRRRCSVYKLWKNISAKSVHLTSLYPTAVTSTNDHLTVLRHYVCT